MNKVILTGNLACNPEIRKTEEGTTRCSFRIAVQRNYKNKSTGKRDADFISVTAWGSLGDICGKYLEKGKKIGLAGRICSRSYEDEEGRMHYITEVVAEDVEFLSYKENTTGGEGTEEENGERYEYLQDEDKQLPF